MFGFGRPRRDEPRYGAVDVPRHRIAAVLQDHLAGTVPAECVSLGDGSVALLVEDGVCEPLERVLLARHAFDSPSAFARALHERVDVETLTSGDGAAGSCTITATFHRPTSAVVRLNVRARPRDIPALRAWASGCLVFAMRRSDLFIGERPYDVGLVLGGLQPSPSIQAVVDHLASYEDQFDLGPETRGAAEGDDGAGSLPIPGFPSFDPVRDDDDSRRGRHEINDPDSHGGVEPDDDRYDDDPRTQGR